MPPRRMTLRLLLPSAVFAEVAGVSRIVVETRAGSLGLLPRRLDCVAALVPGIVVYATDTAAETYFAIDEGLLIKRGPDVRIAVRRATRGDDLDQLQTLVAQEFVASDDETQSVRTVMARLESGFVRRLATLRHD